MPKADPEARRADERARYEQMTPEERERRRVAARAYYQKNKSTPQYKATRRANYRRRHDNDPSFREKQAAAARKWYHANRDRALANRKAYAETKGRSVAHGLTRGEIRARLAAQGGVCAICRSDKPNGKFWHGDHDHETGQFRGVLCQTCNLALGKFGDNLAGIQRVVDYLKMAAA